MCCYYVHELHTLHELNVDQENVSRFIGHFNTLSAFISECVDPSTNGSSGRSLVGGSCFDAVIMKHLCHSA